MNANEPPVTLVNDPSGSPRILSLPLSLADIIEWFQSSGVLEAAIQDGEMVPDFELPNASGAAVSLQELLDRGPVVVSFTLGARSIRCRQSLLALQAALAGIEGRAATLIALTPDPPSISHRFQHAAALTFDLLSDIDGHLAGLFGVAYRPPLALVDWLGFLGVERPIKWLSPEVPLTATYVVTPDGIAAAAFLDANPLLRADPDQVAATLIRLRAANSGSDA